MASVEKTAEKVQEYYRLQHDDLLKFCEAYRDRRHAPAEGPVAKPTVFKHMNSRIPDVKRIW